MTAVAFYISGHGFGHASRQIEVINAFGVLRPDVRIVVRTSASAWLFERTVRVPFELVPGADHQFTKGSDFTRMTQTIADWLIQHLSTTHS